MQYTPGHRLQERELFKRSVPIRGSYRVPRLCHRRASLEEPSLQEDKAFSQNPTFFVLHFAS